MGIGFYLLLLGENLVISLSSTHGRSNRKESLIRMATKLLVLAMTPIIQAYNVDEKSGII